MDPQTDLKEKNIGLFPVLLLLLFVFLISLEMGEAQRTNLDKQFQSLYRPLRLLGMDLAGRSNIGKKVRDGKTQKFNARSSKLFCDAKTGPGRRSAKRPTSVHELRPGDIDIVGALGDSLTAGNGIFASTLLQVMMTENRGVVWSIGGQGTWREFLTLPNILKEFNPNLYGYSLKDGLASERSSKFNIAELGAMSRDIPYEAKILVKRLQNDPNVNMTHDWKLITLLIGNNDFCTDICFNPNPEEAIDAHERNMIKTFRYLRDNVPRLMINVVPAPNLLLLTRYTKLPQQCYLTLKLECPCIMGKNRKYLKNYERLMKKWIAKDFDVAYRDEFNTETFTVNVQPFAQFKDIPKTEDGATDTRYLSEDCFHLSQKAHAACANSLWNNMFEPEGHKTSEWRSEFQMFLCPTNERPFFATRTNSKDINQPL